MRKPSGNPQETLTRVLNDDFGVAGRLQTSDPAQVMGNHGDITAPGQYICDDDVLHLKIIDDEIGRDQFTLFVFFAV